MICSNQLVSLKVTWTYCQIPRLIVVVLGFQEVGEGDERAGQTEDENIRMCSNELVC